MSAVPAPVDKVRDAPSWWMRELRVGQLAELTVYGERMKGRLARFDQHVIEVTIPSSEQIAALRTATVQGTISVSIEGGAAMAPVTCWPVGHSVRLQIIGPVELKQRRQYTRRDLDVMVSLTWDNEFGNQDRVLSRTADISAGGLQIRPANVVWPSRGAPVWLTIDLPGGLPVHLEAEAVGKTLDYGLRLRFVRPPADVVARIRQYVDEGG